MIYHTMLRFSRGDYMSRPGHRATGKFTEDHSRRTGPPAHRSVLVFLTAQVPALPSDALGCSDRMFQFLRSRIHILFAQKYENVEGSKVYSISPETNLQEEGRGQKKNILFILSPAASSAPPTRPPPALLIDISVHLHTKHVST